MVDSPVMRWETGDMVVRHEPEQFIILEAPRRILVSLQLLMANPQAIRMVGDVMYFGSPDEVAYRIDGYKSDPPSLRLERWNA